MKTCVNCQFCERKVVPVSPTQMGMAYVCTHPELLDPVEGSPLPCHTCRSNAEFCSIRGKMWKEKKQESQPIDDKKVIQLQ